MYPSYQSTEDDDQNQQQNQDPLANLAGTPQVPQSPADPLAALVPTGPTQSFDSSAPPVDVAATAPDAGPAIPDLPNMSPMALDSAPTVTVGATGAPRNPYDSMYADTLKKALDSVSSKIDGITADRNKLRDESNSLTSNLGNDMKTAGAGLGATIIAALGGAKPGYAFGAGAKGATEYSNNLEAQEKQRQLEISASLRNDEAQLGDLTKYQQSLTEMPMKQQQELSTDWQKGLVPDIKPGETPFDSKQDSEVALAQQKARGSVANTPINQQDARDLETKLKLQPGSIVTAGDAQRELRAAGYVQQADTFNAKGTAADKKVAAANQVGTMVSPIDPTKPLSTLNQKEIETSHSAFMPIISSLDDLKASVAKYGNMNLGTIGAQQKADIAQYVLQVRKFYGEGARLTENVQVLDQNALGAAVVGENTPEALMQNMTGTDLTKMINDAQAKLLGTYESRMEANNATVDLTKYSNFQPEQAKTLQALATQYGIRTGVGLQPPAAGNTPPVAAPKNVTIDWSKAPPGMNPAQVQAWKQQQLSGAN